MNKTAKFMKVLIDNSTSYSWVNAKNEWYCNGLRYTPRQGVCICGQKHITRIVIIKNKVNGKSLEIGYNCWLSVIGGEKLDTEFKQLRNQYVLYELGIKLPTLYLILRNFESGRINIEEVNNLVYAHFHSLDSSRLLEIQEIIGKMEFVPDVVSIKSIILVWKDARSWNYPGRAQYTMKGVGYNGKIYNLHRWCYHNYFIYWDNKYGNGWKTESYKDPESNTSKKFHFNLQNK